MSKTTKKLCYIALLVAVYVLLSMTFTIKTGNLEITFKSLPVVVAALLFGPAAGGLTALLGEFLSGDDVWSDAHHDFVAAAARGPRLGDRVRGQVLLEERPSAGVASSDLLRGLPCGLLCNQLCDNRLPVAGQPDLSSLRSPFVFS